MSQKCKICNREYDYCHPCAFTKNIFKNAGYCGEDCYHISMALQRYNSKVANAAETVRELKKYNIDSLSLRPSIEAAYQAMSNEIKPKRKAKIIEEIVPQENVEVVINKDEDMTIS